jgi:hypothetical protein
MTFEYSTAGTVQVKTVDYFKTIRPDIDAESMTSAQKSISFLNKQKSIVFQDNQSALLLEKNGHWVKQKRDKTF